MPKPLRISLVAYLSNLGLDEDFVIDGEQFDQNNLGRFATVVNLNTSSRILSFGDIQVPGYAFFRNISTDKAVYLGAGDSDYGYPIEGGKFSFEQYGFGSNSFKSLTWTGGQQATPQEEFILLYPGEVAMFRVDPQAVIRAKGSAFGTMMKYIILED